MVAKEKGASPKGHTNQPNKNCTTSRRNAQRKSQKEKILDYMQKHGSITQAEAVEVLRCYRLSARIKELRDEYTILTVMERNEGEFGHHGRYILKERKESDA